jgi:hypothetical protein
MIRQFRYAKLMKMAGKGNITDGIRTTKPGELAVICPACPYPGINLPEGWQNIEPSKRYVL